MQRRTVSNKSHKSPVVTIDDRYRKICDPKNVRICIHWKKSLCCHQRTIIIRGDAEADFYNHFRNILKSEKIQTAASYLCYFIRWWTFSFVRFDIVIFIFYIIWNQNYLKLKVCLFVLLLSTHNWLIRFLQLQIRITLFIAIALA